MDTSKMALLKMKIMMKATQGLSELPISITGMVAHRHNDGIYVHYAPSCWPRDLNFTISLLARLFYQLEGPSIGEKGNLFLYPPANAMICKFEREKTSFLIRCLTQCSRHCLEENLGV